MSLISVTYSQTYYHFLTYTVIHLDCFNSHLCSSQLLPSTYLQHSCNNDSQLMALIVPLCLISLCTEQNAKPLAFELVFELPCEICNLSSFTSYHDPWPGIMGPDCPPSNAHTAFVKVLFLKCPSPSSVYQNATLPSRSCSNVFYIWKSLLIILVGMSSSQNM